MVSIFDRQADGSQSSALKKLLQKHEKEGRITKKDLCSFLDDVGLPMRAHEIEKKMFKVSGNDNGILNINEFFNLILNELDVCKSEKEAMDAFRVFDKEESGFINASDLRHIMTNLGSKLTDDEVDQMIRKSDLDGDGHINYEEFVKSMMPDVLSAQAIASKQNYLLQLN